MQDVSTELEAASQARGKQPAATVRTAVAGVGGYAGGELARLLLAHPRLAATKPLFLGRVADDAEGGRIALEQIHPQLALGEGKRQPEIARSVGSWFATRARRLCFWPCPMRTRASGRRSGWSMGCE